ncbi:MAG: TonB-dependent receptor, partial [bacterium]|nr:TonB-dependent receptor [bacterium]
IYGKNKFQLSKKISIESNVVYRATHVLPETSFRYHYRFPDLSKNYVAFSYQGYIEERLTLKHSDRSDFLFGLKVMNSVKSPRVVSLGVFPKDTTRTESAWTTADSGNGLGVAETFPAMNVTEMAAYGLWNNKWWKKVSTSIGLRFDSSSEYGEILNPRLGLILKPTKAIGIKALIGTAFRQPSIFELTSEFRGNPNLGPEKIITYELELNTRLAKTINVRTNIFYSVLSDFIGRIPDPTMPAGERYENLTKARISGMSLVLDYQMTRDIRFFSNYMFLQGKDEGEDSWKQLDQTARHKVNGGVNIRLLNRKLNVNFRANCVGKRKAQATNAWLQKYEKGFAPGYIIANLVLTFKGFKRIKPQLIVKNLFDKQFYGVARETGSGMIDDYDYRTTPNPSGFIPSYHPQPGRTIMFNVKYEF